MGATIADRIRWAVDVLAISPSDRLLEIGCGNGAAVAEICRTLTNGSITALDRSVKMIRLAEKNNAEHVASGKARFLAVSLHEADLAQSRFNKIFAVNVNQFWLDRDCGLDLMKQMLAPGGAVYVFNQPPAASKLQLIADRTAGHFISAGFAIKHMIAHELLPVPGVCIVAEVDESKNGSENE
ncbi:SAM-dependent methyltransferase [Paenibacillus agaridevorans]|uniref:SAM-dependent methyltransferase n=1 Tax=Paenibacillus agaridevorans TaxID=171404 RepID=A0A2R5EIL1_9BACL|nr:class I SAM-dependent methyltransferase [Paenibacillus agaridevorans]GBG06440.1 SAM-dependent methyltransferase [Paenibacillus agaridevorans]